MTCFKGVTAVTKQEYVEKLERGLAQVRAGQGIVKTMDELAKRSCCVMPRV